MIVEELLLGGTQEQKSNTESLPPRHPSRLSLAGSGKKQSHHESVIVFNDGSTIDIVDAVEELRRMLQAVEAKKETLTIQMKELEDERDLSLEENVILQQENRTRKEENEELAKENTRLKREVDLYRTKIFTVVNQEGSSLIHGLPDINISFQSRSVAASASAVAAEYDYLSPATSTSQALYIINQLVHNNNDLVERNTFLEKEKKRMDIALSEKETQLRMKLQELQEKETSNLKMKTLLTQANTTISATVEDYKILQEQVQSLTAKLKEMALENTHLKALVAPPQRSKAIAAATASYLSDRSQQQQQHQHEHKQQHYDRTESSRQQLLLAASAANSSVRSPPRHASPAIQEQESLLGSAIFQHRYRSNSHELQGGVYASPIHASTMSRDGTASPSFLNRTSQDTNVRREVSTADLVARLQAPSNLQNEYSSTNYTHSGGASSYGPTNASQSVSRSELDAKLLEYARKYPQSHTNNAMTSRQLM
jgi:hypothetical protein